MTCTTVGVATHGAPENTKMTQMATATGGKAYLNPPPRAIPAIYIKETRLVSQSFVYEKRFVPKLQIASGPTDKLSGPLPPLFGFVRTTLKQNPLVEMGIEGPPTLDQRFPILASWQYGLGKAVAFTSDAKTSGGRLGWDREWAGSDMYLKFWEQVIGWSLRGVETGKLSIATEYRDGKVRVTVDGRDDKNRPLTDLAVARHGHRAELSMAGAKPIELKFEQKNSGEYEAEFKAEEEGTYFINAAGPAYRQANEGRQRGRGRGVRQHPLRRDAALLAGVRRPGKQHRPARQAGRNDRRQGRTTRPTRRWPRPSGPGEVFRKSAVSAQSPQPMWYWLVLLAGHRPVLRRGRAADRRRAGGSVGGRGQALGTPPRPGRRRCRIAAVPGTAAEPQGPGRGNDWPGDATIRRRRSNRPPVPPVDNGRRGRRPSGRPRRRPPTAKTARLAAGRRMTRSPA